MSNLSEQTKIWLLFSFVVAILSTILVLLILHPWAATHVLLFLVVVSAGAALLWGLYDLCREVVRSHSRRKNL